MTTFVSHVFAELQRVDSAAATRLGCCRKMSGRESLYPGTPVRRNSQARGCVGRSERMKSCLKA
jgi:hypothetical protein